MCSKKAERSKLVKNYQQKKREKQKNSCELVPWKKLKFSKKCV